jgi:uridine kinase
MAQSGAAGSRTLVVVIAGCSGSGKTTLAEELARELSGTHFTLDHYYRDLSHLPEEARAVQNFDDPAMLESDLLIEQVAALRRGDVIAQPQYDFANHTRRIGMAERLVAQRFLIVEGNFALHYEGLRALADLRVYVEAPDAVCYQRRLARDVRERGRSPESVAKQYAETVRPMAERYVLPSAKYADVIVNGTAALDWSVEAVRAALHRITGDRGPS